ncbi:hypothetical protein RFM41_07715 [Mesorhizobium sp. VK25A]|nr:hypothetical protein [Mesorhizobium sp. VK25D]MDX8543621.1 hypothetical protein [Mesorhizobium sp. VK25A]
MRFTALQDPCGQWMVFDLRSGYPAQIPDMMLLGLTREEAEELAGQANELLSTPRPATLSRYFSLLSIFYWPPPEQSDSIPTSMHGMEAGSGSSTWSKPRLRVVQRSP